jgi:DNA-binding SARP family transcriptional activator
VEYLVLGPVEIVRGGRAVTLGPPKQRSLLSLLLIHANEVVSTDRIIDSLWGDQGAADRQNALWVLISNLRSVLEPERDKRSAGTVLVTRSPGYVLQVDRDELDVWRFERLVHEGRALIDSDPATASITIGEGLALWRGCAYDDVTYESFAQPEIGRLEELRLEAVELRVDADLRQGLDSELVSELEGLVREHPLREQLAAHLMLALYRSGRRADALRVFQRLRTRLGEEIGLEPSSILLQLEERIVVGDPTLDDHGPLRKTETRLAVRGYELRDRLTVNESEVEYRAYQPALGREVAVTVVGPDVADEPDFICRFEVDAERVARLDHPHLVPLCDYWREPHAAYLVAPAMARRNLCDVIRQGPLDLTEATQLVFDVGSALAVAHRNGVVHGRVETASIRIDGGAGHLSGFTIGRDVALQGGADHGASPFASPEQLEGEAPTRASDVYGLGRLFEYALTGEGGAARRPATVELPVAIASEIRRATSVDPRDRVPTPQPSSGHCALLPRPVLRPSKLTRRPTRTRDCEPSRKPMRPTSSVGNGSSSASWRASAIVDLADGSSSWSGRVAAASRAWSKRACYRRCAGALSRVRTAGSSWTSRRAATRTKRSRVHSSGSR